MKTKISLLAMIAFSVIGFSSCKELNRNNFEEVLNSINIEDLRSYVEVLGSDEFEGRKPFSNGEDLTINYLADQMERIGLEPAFGNTYFQDVQMAEISSTMNMPAILKSSTEEISLNFPDDIALSSKKTVALIEIEESDLVFAGFGIVAPEYDWDDYKDLDVKGKTVVVLVNDPGLYTGEENLFKARTMTYYGRWTYKYEEAERQGAEGVIIIHETLGAGYPYDIPRKSALSSSFYLAADAQAESSLLFNGWVSAEAAQRIFDSYGISVDSLRNSVDVN